jgi:hypothetical protein
MGKLDNKIAVVSGAARGQGRSHRRGRLRQVGAMEGLAGLAVEAHR